MLVAACSPRRGCCLERTVAMEGQGRRRRLMLLLGCAKGRGGAQGAGAYCGLSFAWGRCKQEGAMPGALLLSMEKKEGFCTGTYRGRECSAAARGS
ncbi:hypothetical protein U9M48_003168 [Paspalum notatum var. saurae]|uniref:Uncharacterized protein n=1 Tax=Paspalum notatum var. saurae TaxID=547442 RepID=A0AAQ3PH11_PASNO